VRTWAKVPFSGIHKTATERRRAALIWEDGDQLAGLAITLGKFGRELLGQIPVLGFHGGL
jgi:hypothetical protein